MTNEDVALLAQWLGQHPSEIISSSFDRNGSHTAGEYREHYYLYEEGMRKLIREWCDEWL